MEGSTEVRPLITSYHPPVSYGSPPVGLMLNKFAGKNFVCHVCACVRAHVYVRVYACVCVCALVYVRSCVCARVYVCMCMRVCVCVYVCMRITLCVYIYIYIHIFVVIHYLLVYHSILTTAKELLHTVPEHRTKLPSLSVHPQRSV